jgi:hypothetical protein
MALGTAIPVGSMMPQCLTHIARYLAANTASADIFYFKTVLLHHLSVYRHLADIVDQYGHFLTFFRKAFTESQNQGGLSRTQIPGYLNKLHVTSVGSF